MAYFELLLSTYCGLLLWPLPNTSCTSTRLSKEVSAAVDKSLFSDIYKEEELEIRHLEGRKETAWVQCFPVPTSFGGPSRGLTVSNYQCTGALCSRLRHAHWMSDFILKLCQPAFWEVRSLSHSALLSSCTLLIALVVFLLLTTKRQVSYRYYLHFTHERSYRLGLTVNYSSPPRVWAKASPPFFFSLSVECVS